MRFAILFLGLLGVLSAGCGPDFDPPSELHSLRILGVEKDVPYAQPGQTVNLRMLWSDASLQRPRPVQVAWSPPCFDPPGDLYYACFADPSVFGGMLTLNQDTASFTMPTDIITGTKDQPRAAPADPRNPQYGIAYVFFAICAGELAPVTRTDETTFPVGCKGPDGKFLGSDDFVAGYTSVYSFKSFSNHNPNVTGFSFNGLEFAPDATTTTVDPAAPSCLNETCASGSNAESDFDFDCAEFPERCVPTCPDDGDPKCPGYNLNPLVDKNDPANQDQDDVSAKLLGRQVGEQMWINYYTEEGSFKSPVRLLNDASSGWNKDYGTKFYAPKAPGLVRVWGVVHDNRGGVAWAGVTLKIQ